MAIHLVVGALHPPTFTPSHEKPTCWASQNARTHAQAFASSNGETWTTIWQNRALSNICAERAFGLKVVINGQSFARRVPVPSVLDALPNEGNDATWGSGGASSCIELDLLWPRGSGLASLPGWSLKGGRMPSRKARPGPSLKPLLGPSRMSAGPSGPLKSLGPGPGAP